MSIRGTKYIVRRGDVFQLRLPIPKDLQGKLNRKELRRSLKTGDAPTAKRRAFRATLLFMELCDSVRGMQDVSAARANEIVQAFFRLLVQSYTPPASFRREPFDKQYADQIYAADSYAQAFSERFEGRDFTKSDLKIAEQLLAEFGMKFGNLTPARQMQIWDGMRRAYDETVRYIEYESEMTGAAYSSQDELFQAVDLQESDHVVTNRENPLPRKTANGPSLSEIIARYIGKGTEHGITGSPWSASARLTNEKVLKWFQDHLIQDKFIADIDRNDCRNFRDAYLRVRLKTDKQVLFADAQTTDLGKRISPQTAKNQFGYLKSFFNWCEAEGYVEKNPIGKITIAAPKKQKDQQRRPFSVDEVNTLFNSPLYLGYRSHKKRYIEGNVSPKRDGFFWLPVILLYTGMRLSEAIHVPLKNVVIEEAASYFDLRSQSQSLKTSQSVRKVPIHPDLYKVGFVEWVSNRKLHESPETLLINDLNTQSNPGNYFSKAFGRCIDELVSTDPLIATHSFRHYAKDRARDAMLKDGMMNEIFGHEGAKTVGDTYGLGTSIKVLCQQFALIDFGLSSVVKTRIASK